MALPRSLWFLLAATGCAAYTAFDDASFAIMTRNISDVLGAHKKEFYDSYLEGCRTAAKAKAASQCDSEDDWRMHMNMYQTASVYNYTELGFAKIRLPEDLFADILKFWERNKDQSIVEWTRTTAYHNNWEHETTVVRMENASLPGGGPPLTSKISNTARSVLEEWTGQRLAAASVYGIRSYHEGAVLSPHVDRMPLITSCIINVDQDVDEDWVLEVYDHTGVAHNISMVPGDMVLYESHSTIHGRPFPLKGRFYANIFVHFEVMGPLDATERVDANGLPPYIIPGSTFDTEWRRDHPQGWDLLSNVRKLIAAGDVRTLEYLAQVAPDELDKPDPNGWKPLHEAVRINMLEVTQFLVENGADPTESTHPHLENGWTPLKIAVSNHGENSPIATYLREQIALREDEEEL